MTHGAEIGMAGPGWIESLHCPGVDDAAAWNQKNRVRLYPEQKNRWLLVRSRRDNLERKDVRQKTLNALRVWFSNVPLGDESEIALPSPTGDAGKIDHVKWGPITTSREAAFAAVKKLGWKEAEWREQKDPEPSLESAPAGTDPWWVPIEFTYRGARQDIPWPTASYLSSKDCPTNALWMLISSFEPPRPGTREAALPPPTSFWGGVADELPDMPKGFSLVSTALIAGLAGFGAWALYKGATK